MKRTKADPRPKDPPEDEPGPLLLTSKRAANQVEALYLELMKIVGRLDGLSRYVESQVVLDSVNALTAELRVLVGIRARLLTGEIPITRGEDGESYAKRQPLIAAIEARTNGELPANGTHEPAGKAPLKALPGGTLPVRACDIEPFWSGGKTSRRYQGVQVWAVCQRGKVPPIYGVVAATRAQAAAFVTAQRGKSHRLTLRPLEADDLAKCSVYFDGRQQPFDAPKEPDPAEAQA